MTVLGQDTAIRSDHSGGWGTATDGQTWARLGGAATESLTSNELVITANTAIVFNVLGSLTPTDCEVVARTQASSTTDVIGVALRSGPTASTGMVARINSTNFALLLRSGGTNTQLASATFAFAANTWYWIRFRAVGTAYFARIWADGSAEPASWTINSTTDATIASGQFGTYTQNGASGDTAKYDSFLTVDYALTDSVTASETLLDGLANTPIADSATGTESVLDASAFVPVESVSASESVLQALAESMIDSVTVAESVLAALAFVPSESVSAAESVVQAVAFVPSESTSSAENVLSALASSSTNSVTCTESGTLTDTFVPTDALSGIDSLAQALAWIVMESGTLDDSASSYSLAEAYTDAALSALESLVVGGSSLAVADSLSVSETVVSALNFIPIDTATPVDLLAALTGAIFSPTVLGSDSAIRANHFGGWGTSTDGQAWVRAGTAATLSVVSHELLLTGISAQVWMLLGAKTPTDAELLMRFQSTATGDQPGLFMRYSSTSNNMIARVTNASTLSLIARSGGTNTQLATASITYTASSNYWLRFKAVGTLYWVRFWVDGSAEPTTWNINAYSDATWASGQFGIYAQPAVTTDTNQYDTFYAVDYALSEGVFGTELLSDALSASLSDSGDTLQITDSLPNYFPADVVVAVETVFDALSSTYSDSGDTASLSEVDLATTAISTNDGSLLPDDSLSSYFPAIIFAADTATAIEVPTFGGGPFITDVLISLESVLYALSEALTDTAPPLSDSIIPGNLFPFTDSLTGAESLALALTETLADGGTLLSDSLIRTVAFTLPADTAPPLTDLVSETLAFIPAESVTGVESLALALAITFTESSFTGDILLVTVVETAPADTASVGAESIVEVVGFAPSESVTAIESVAEAVTLNFATESASASDLFSTAYILLLPADTLSPADVLLATLILNTSDALPLLQELGSSALSFATTDNGQLADALAEATAWTAPSESGTLAENVLLTLSESASDALTTSDSLIASATSNNLAFAEVNQLTILDQLALLFQFSWSDSALSPLESALPQLLFAPTESMTTSETVTSAFAVTFANDLASANDTSSLSTLFALPSSDTAIVSETAVDAVAFVPVDAGTPVEQGTQSLATTFPVDGTQAFDAFLALPLLLTTDALSAAELLTVQAAYLPVDTPILIESVLLSLVQNVTDSGVVSDTLFGILLVLPTDTASALEILAAGSTLLWSDALAPTDIGVLTFAFATLDSLALSDVLVESVALTLTDIPLSPLESRQVGLAFITTDVVAVQESVLYAGLVQASDLVLVSDLLAFAVGVTVAFAADAVSTNEVATFVVQLQAFDVVSVIDSSSVAVDTNVYLFTETIVATEQLLSTLLLTQQDSALSVTDSMLAISALYLSAIAVVRSGLARSVLRTGQQNAAVRDGKVQTHIR